MFQKLPNALNKIVIFRVLKLGDMLCSIPAIKLIRRNYPTAHISLVGHPLMKDLFDRFPDYVDHFIPFPGFPGMPEQHFDPKEFLNFLSSIQSQEFDLAIQLHGSGELTNSIVSLFNAKWITGFYKEGNYCPNPSTFKNYPEHLSEVHRCLSIKDFLHFQDAQDHLEYPISAEDENVLSEILSGQQINLTDKKYYCIHPGASSESKRWSKSYFAQVADTLVSRGYKVVFTGSASESPLVTSILEEMVGEADNVARLNLPLGPLAALIKKSAGVICNDTGISHLSAALQKKSIVIFTETDPARWAPLNFHLHRSFLHPTVGELVGELNHLEVS